MTGATHPRIDVPDALADIGGGRIEWRASNVPIAYPDALAGMEERAGAIRRGEADELVWLLEHPPLYTAGTSANPAELFNPQGFPVYAAGRGGRYTYHGPGQRVVYLMLDLERRGRDLKRYVHALEGWAIGALSEFGVTARRAPGRIGIWVDQGSTEAKIGAIGVRVRRWVTMHGLAINVAPSLADFSGIVPCGIAEYPVTSLEALGIDADLARFDTALANGFNDFLAALGGDGGKA